jgi:hypothetical protein
MSVRVVMTAVMLLAFAVPAFASITFVNSWTGTNNGGVVVDTSTGTQMATGDVIVCGLETYFQTISQNGGNTMTAGPAFNNGGSGALNEAVFYRVATAGDIGSTFTFNTSVFGNGGCAAFRGVSNGSPIDAQGTGSIGTSATITAAAITLSNSGDALLWLGGQNVASSTLSSFPGSFAGMWNVNGSSGQLSFAGYELGLSSGSTGTISGTSSASDPYTVVLLALSPNTGATATPTGTATPTATATATATPTTTATAKATPTATATATATPTPTATPPAACNGVFRMGARNMGLHSSCGASL